MSKDLPTSIVHDRSGDSLDDLAAGWGLSTECATCELGCPRHLHCRNVIANICKDLGNIVLGQLKIVPGKKTMMEILKCSLRGVFTRRIQRRFARRVDGFLATCSKGRKVRRTCDVLLQVSFLIEALNLEVTQKDKVPNFPPVLVAGEYLLDAVERAQLLRA